MSDKIDMRRRPAVVERQQAKGVEGKLKRGGADAAVDAGRIGRFRRDSAMIRAQGKICRIEEALLPETSRFAGAELPGAAPRAGGPAAG